MQWPAGSMLFMMWTFWYSTNLRLMGNMMTVLKQKRVEIVVLEKRVEVSSDRSVILMKSLADKQASFETYFMWTVFKTLHYMRVYKHYEDFQINGLEMLNTLVNMMQKLFKVEYIQKNLLQCFEGVLPTMLDAMQNHQVFYIKRTVMCLTIDFVILGMKLEASLCSKMTRMCLNSVKILDKTEKMQESACVCLAIFSTESIAMEFFEAGLCFDSIGEVALVLKKSIHIPKKRIAINCLLLLLRAYHHRVPVKIFEVLFTEMYSQYDLLEKANQCVEIMLSDSNASVEEYRAQFESLYYDCSLVHSKSQLAVFRQQNGY